MIRVWIFMLMVLCSGSLAAEALRVGVSADYPPLVYRQDGKIVDCQTPGLQCNPPLMWVGDADQQARWYHQCKREWNNSRREGRAFVNCCTKGCQRR